MNHVYRLVWNATHNLWVPVAEIVTKQKKGGRTKVGRSRIGFTPMMRLFRRNLLATALALIPGATLAAPGAEELPTGGIITSGSGSISQSGANMAVTQNSDRMIAEWQSFNIGSQASVTFSQPSSSSVALNRVTTQNPTEILGQLSANGQVMLVNPAGIVFSQGSQINVGALVASTLDISDADFNAGNYSFSGSSGEVLNQGEITTPSGGRVAFLAPVVKNEGDITTPDGATALVGANEVDLDFTGDGMITVRVEQGAINALVENKQLIKADNGAVILTARATDQLTRAAVNNSGIIEATGLSSEGGRIILEGDDIHLTSTSEIDASGATGGGEVLVGGDWQGSGDMYQATTVTMDEGATIDASATDNGDGGKVVLWSDITNTDSVTEVHGEITARGGPNGGDGGAIETSGATINIDNISVDAGSTSGKAGLWLIDPYDYTIDSSAASSISSALATSDVTVTTDSNNSSYGSTGSGTGHITLSSDITKTSGSNTTTLTLKSAAKITFNNNTISGSSGNSLNVVLWGESDGGSSYGTAVGTINTYGGHVWVGGGSGTTTWNGLTVGDGLSMSDGTDNWNGMDLYGNITTSGGDIYLAADDGNSSGNPSIGALNNITLSTGSGDISFIVRDAGSFSYNSKTITLDATGTFTIAPPSGESFVSAVTWNGSGSPNLTGSDSLSGLVINSIANLTGLNIGTYGGTGVGGDTVYTSSNTQNITISSAINTAGAITIYGGDVTVSNAITSSAAGDILLSASGNLSSGSTTRYAITNSNGAINAYADSDASGAGQLNLDYLTFDAGSSALTLRGETFSWSTAADSHKPYINGTGSFTLESSDSVFGQSVSSSWFNWDQDGDGIGAVTIGKSTNTTNITIDSAISSTGAITVYGGAIDIDANIIATGGNILLDADTGSAISTGLDGVDIADVTIQTITSGDITILGRSGNGATSGLMGVQASGGSTTINSSGALTITGISESTSSSATRGMWLKGDIDAVGDITLTGTSNASNKYDVSLDDATVNTSAGAITFNAINTDGGVILDGTIGITAGGGNNITINADRHRIYSGTSTFTTTGAVSFLAKSGSTSFTTWFNPTGTYVFDSGITSLTIGNSANTQDVTLDSSISINGPITVYGGNIAANANLTSSTSGADILLKASGNITQAASTSIITNAGDITLWSDRDADGGYIYINDSSTLDSRSSSDRTAGNTSTASGGGAITLAGGSTSTTLASGTEVPTGNALQSSGSTTPGGVTLGTYGGGHNANINIYSGGGDISLTGKNTSGAGSVNSGIAIYEGTTIDAGTTGDITLTGTGSDNVISTGMDIQAWRAGVATSLLRTKDGNISLTGTASGASSNNFGLSLQANASYLLTTEATGTGTVSITGSATGTGAYDLYALNNNILASSGTITLSGSNSGASYIQGITVGYKASTDVTSSTSNITILEDNISLYSGNGLQLNTSGTAAIQPYGNDFSSAFTDTDIGLVSSITGLTIGKASSADGTSDVDVTIGSAMSIAGPISVYGAAVTLNAGLTTTNTSTGDIAISTSGLTGSSNITLATGRGLTVTQSGSSTYSGVISGTNATLTKAGAGALTLSADNTYTGATTISAGTLQIGSGSTTGALTTSGVTNNGTLKYYLGEDATIGYDISGTGSLEVVGGEYTLFSGFMTTSAQTIASNTTVAEVLARLSGARQNGQSIHSGATQEAGIYNTNYDAATNTGTFQVQQYDTSYTKTLFVTLAQSGNDVTFAADTSGSHTNGTAYMSGNQLGTDMSTGATYSMGLATSSGAVGYGLDQLDISSKITFTGTNSYTGTTTLSNTTTDTTSSGSNRYVSTAKGVLQIGASGTAGSFTGTNSFVNSGVLQIDRSDSMTLDRNISGAGTVIKKGANTLSYTGTQTLTGDTYVTEGTYSIGAGGSAGSVSGNIVDVATVQFNRSDNVTHAGIISGAGAVIKAGSNTVTLTADSTYTGATTISGGTLVIENDTPSTGSSSYGGAGTLTIQSSSNSFSSAFTQSSSGFSYGSTLGALTIGKTTNTQTVTLDSAITIAGAITVYGGDITVSQNLNTTSGGANGDVLLKGSGDLKLASSKSITTTGGDVTFWADSDASSAGGIHVDQSASIVTSGGNITLAGGADDGSNGGTSSDGIPDGYASNMTVSNRNQGVLLGQDHTTIGASSVTLNAAAGNIRIHGQSTTNGLTSYGNGVTLNESGMIRTTNGDITIIGSASGETYPQGVEIRGTSGSEATVQATGTGSISITGTGTGFVSVDITDSRILAASGAITITGTTDGFRAGNSTNTVLGYMSGSDVTSSSSNITLQTDTFTNQKSTINTSGTLTIQSNGSAFSSSYDHKDWTIASTVSGLTIGKSSNSTNVTVSKATTVAGPITVYGSDITLNAALAASGSNIVTLTGSGSVTDGASGYLTATNLLLNGSGSYTLDHASNDVTTLAATGIGNLSYADSSALTIGTVSSTSGITAAGANTIAVSTLSGDLTLSQNITTTNTGSSAVVLNAGSNTAAGTSSGGNLIISGSPTISTGSGGRSTLYSGSISGSTGLTSFVGSGSGRFRYNSDESASGYHTTNAALSSGTYAIYREQPTLTITADDETVTYGTSPSLSTTLGSTQNGDTSAQIFSTAASVAVGGSTSTSGNYTQGSHTLTPSGAVDQLGYGLSYTAGTLTVNKKALTASYSVTSKTYDGGSSATVTGSSSDIVTNDVVTFSESATFANVNAGSQTVNISSIAISGADSGNYTLQNTTASPSGTVTAKTVSLSASKTYDGSTDLTGDVTITTGVGSETLTYSGATASNAHVATSGKYINAITLADATDGSGGLASNYQLPTLNNSNAAVTINAATLTPTITNSGYSQSYDGDTTADITPTYSFSGFIAGDTAASLSNTGKSYNSANVASASTITVSGLSISSITGSNSSAASDYTLDSSSKTVNATIDAASLTVTATNRSKSYGDTLTLGSSSFTSSGLQNSETIGSVTLTSTNSYDSSTTQDANTYSSEIVPSSATGGSFTASNYSISYVSGDLTIDPKTLNISYAGTNKTYDGTSSATVAETLTGVINSDTVTVTESAAFADVNVGTGKTINVSSVSLGGADAGNYSLGSSTTTTANITAKTVSLSASRTYDGTTDLTGDITITTGVGSETLTYSGATANNAHVATSGKYINAITLANATDGSGGLASNYQLPTLNSSNAAVTINAKTLTPTITNSGYSQSYDGDTSADITPTYSFSGFVSGDTDASLSNTGKNYNSANVSSASTVTISGLSISSITGSNSSVASDYVLDSSSKTVNATISKKTVGLSASKSYDGGTDLTGDVTITTGVGSETLTYSGATSNDAHVATSSKYINAITLTDATDGSGGLVSNYQLPTLNNSNAPVTISAATLTPTITNSGYSQVYDGDTAADITPTYSFSGLIGGDSSAALTNSGKSYNDKDVADATTITVSGLSIGSITGSNSSAASDYVLDASSKTVNATITKKTVSLSASKTYDGSTDLTNAVTLGSYVGSETLTYSGATSNSKDVAGADGDTGTADNYISAITLVDGTNGGLASNYQLPTLNASNAAATISQKALSVSGTTVANRTYDGTTNATFTVGSISNYVGSETLSITATGSLSSKGAGVRTTTAAYTLVDGTNGGLASNYSLADTSGLSATISKAALTVAASSDADFVTYHDSDSSYAGVSYSGFVAGETNSELGGTLSISRSNSSVTAAGAYSGVLVPSGLTATNYDISYTNGDYTIVPADQLLVEVSDVSTTYGTGPSFTVASAKYLDSSGNSVVTIGGSGATAGTSRSASGNTITLNDGAGGTAQFTLGSLNTTSSNAGEVVVGNYSIGSSNITRSGSNFSDTVTFTGTHTVTQKTVSPSISGVSKTYDGSTAMIGLNLGLSGVVSGDTVSLSGTGAFSTENVGTGLGYSVVGMGISGADSANYYLSGSTSTSGSNGVITAKALSISGTTVSGKTYDTSNTATVTAGTLSGMIGSETLGVSAAATFDSANAGSRTATAVYTLSNGGGGGLASNYTLADTSHAATISQKAINIQGLTASNKTFDGNTSATVSGTAAISAGASGSSDGFYYNSDALSLSGTAVGTFADNTVGTSKAIEFNQLTLAGAAAGNYLLTSTLTADINAAIVVNPPPILTAPKADGVTTSPTGSGGTTSGTAGSVATSFDPLSTFNFGRSGGSGGTTGSPSLNGITTNFGTTSPSGGSFSGGATGGGTSGTSSVITPAFAGSTSSSTSLGGTSATGLTGTFASAPVSGGITGATALPGGSAATASTGSTSTGNTGSVQTGGNNAATRPASILNSSTTTASTPTTGGGSSGATVTQSGTGTTSTTTTTAAVNSVSTVGNNTRFDAVSTVTTATNRTGGAGSATTGSGSQATTSTASAAVTTTSAGGSSTAGNSVQSSTTSDGPSGANVTAGTEASATRTAGGQNSTASGATATSTTTAVATTEGNSSANGANETATQATTSADTTTTTALTGNTATASAESSPTTTASGAGESTGRGADTAQTATAQAVQSTGTEGTSTVADGSAATTSTANQNKSGSNAAEFTVEAAEGGNTAETQVDTQESVESTTATTELATNDLGSMRFSGDGEVVQMSMKVDGESAVIETGDTTGPGLDGASSVEIASMVLFTDTGNGAEVSGSVTVSDKGQSLSATSNDFGPSYQQSVDLSLEGVRYVESDYQLTPTQDEKVVVGVSPDNMLVISVSPEMESVMDKRHIVLLGLSVAKKKLGVKVADVRSILVDVSGAGTVAKQRNATVASL